MAVVVDQMDGLAAVAEAIADGSIIGIEGDGELRWAAAAEEDDVRAGANDGIIREAEVSAQGPLVAQPPARLGKWEGSRRYKVR